MTKNIDFGIRKELTIPTAAFRVNYVASIGQNKYLLTSNKSISIYEGDNCVISLPIKTQIALYIEKYDALIYVPKEKNRFIVHFVNNIKDPVYEGPEIDHLGINHLVYSPKSETIISFGIGVRTWYFKCPIAYNRRMNQKIDIQFTPRASFFDDSMNKDLYPPSFDPLTEQILFNTRQELFIYNLDGKLIDCPVTYKTENFTMFKINPFNSNFITCDLEQGLISWSKLGTVINHYPFNVKKVFTMFFANDEFALIIDSNYKVDIIDLNTQDIFAGIQLEEKPQRFYFLQSEIPIFVSIGTKTYFYKVSTFWKQWTSLTTTVLKMTRCPSTEKSARLLFLLSNSTFAFLSPKSSNKVGVCLSQNTSFPLDFYVQRSDMKNKDRDLLKLIQNDGTFEIFQMNDIPFNSIKSLKLNATAFCHTKLREKEILIVGTTFGKILILEDNDELNELQKVTTVQEPPLKILVHEKTMSLFVCYLRSIMVYNLSNLTLKYQIKQGHCEMREIFWDYLINGHDDGRIEIFTIQDDKIVTAFEENRPIHDGKITVLTKGSEFFLTAAVNGSVIVWTKNLEILAELKFPLQIYSSCFLNGTRSILFGLEKSVMILDGSIIFDKEVDEEDFIWDNLDRRIDQFELNTYQFTKKNEISSSPSLHLSEKKVEEEEKEFDFVRRKRRNSKLIIKCLSVTAFDKVEITQDPTKTEEEKEDQKLTEDDKNKLLQDMINIDNNEKKVVQKIEPPKPQIIEKHEEEEDDYIEEYEEDVYEQPKIVLEEKSEVIVEEKSDKNEEEEIDENINLFDDEEEEAIVKQKKEKKNINYELPKMIKVEEEKKIEKEIDEEKVFKKTKENAKKAKNTIVQTPVKSPSQPKPPKPPKEPKVMVIDSPLFKEKNQKNKSKLDTKKKSKSKVQKTHENKIEESEVKLNKSDNKKINSDNEINKENEENNKIEEEVFEEEKVNENSENEKEKIEENSEEISSKIEENSNENSHQKNLEKIDQSSEEKVDEKIEKENEQKEQKQNQQNQLKDKKKSKSNEVKNETKISSKKSQKTEEKSQKNPNENKNQKLQEEKTKPNESKISPNKSKDKISLLGSKPMIKQPNFPNKNKIKPTEIRNRRNSMDSESQHSQKENSPSLLVSEEKIPEIKENQNEIQTFVEQKEENVNQSIETNNVNDEIPQNEEKISEISKISSDIQENSENSTEKVENNEELNQNIQENQQIPTKSDELNQNETKISKNEEEEQNKEKDYHKTKRTNSPLGNLQPKTILPSQHLYGSKRQQIQVQSPPEPKHSNSPRINYVIMDLGGFGISQAKSTHDLVPKDMILPKIRLGKKTFDYYDSPLLSPPVRRPPLIVGQRNSFQRKILSPRPIKQQNVRNQMIYHHNKPL